MDAIDLRILDLLQNDGRMTMKDLGGQIGLTSPATIERVKKLEESGVIRGYKAILDIKRAGASVRAFLLVNSSNQPCHNFAEFAASHNSILSCHRITGDCCYLVEAVVNGVNELEALLDQIMVFGTAQVHIILSSPVEHKAVRLADSQ